MSSIEVRNARQHNLQGIDVAIPHGRITVVTGVSGSGKSSLAFDTIHVEGQRRFLQTIRRAARRAVDEPPRPAVDEILGLPPTLAVDQAARGVPFRATLASLTELADLLQILYARAGVVVCPRCGSVLQTQSATEIVRRIAALPEGTKVLLLAPLRPRSNQTIQHLLQTAVKRGFLRARIDGELCDLADCLQRAELTPPLEIVVDRLKIKPGLQRRLSDSVRTALQLAEGIVLVSFERDGHFHDLLLSTRWKCPACGYDVGAVEPRHFDLDSPYGACPDCTGIGWLATDAARSDSVPGPSISEELPGDVLEWLDWARRHVGQHVRLCPRCLGRRFAPLADYVRVFGRTLPELTRLDVRTCREVLANGLKQVETGSPDDTDASRRAILERIVPELLQRLEFLCHVGVGYLTLGRPAVTLSGGELQRARLARCLGTGLIHVCYVLDEPTFGLHPADTRRIIEVLRRLRDSGNTVIVVEHDLDVIRSADHIIELGPAAGPHGGQLVFAGSVAQLSREADTATARALRGETSRLAPRAFEPGRRGWLRLEHATRHNLRDVTVELPVNALTVVAGVSGSGKSTLVVDTLVPLAQECLAEEAAATSPLSADEHPRSDVAAASPDPATPHRPRTRLRLRDVPDSHRPQAVQIVDHRAIGRSPRSTPATFLRIWDAICTLFARTREARLHGFPPSRFRFNDRAGRCPQCRGRGVEENPEPWIAELPRPCPLCHGRRFDRRTLAVRYRGLSVGDVLELTFEQASAFFRDVPSIRQPAETLCELGLAYLKLGQPATSLSGGEAQRLKLARFLTQPSRRTRCPALLVLDEPTAGLHPHDVIRLLHVFRRLLDAGHTLCVVEHQLDVLRAADWIIELGPGAGPDGGRLIAAGPPAELRRHRSSSLAGLL